MSDVNSRISDIVSSNDVVLFMKGTPLFPQCGFSSRAVAILEHCGVPYEGVDVLQDMEIRQGIKGFSDWPTIRSEEHTSELQSLMRISYAVFCLKKKKTKQKLLYKI